MQRSSLDSAAGTWFAAAIRAYLEGHQGCARCEAQHCVIRWEWQQRVEFYCTACDFSTCHDGASGRFFVALGEPSHRAGILLGVPEGD
jgi:hypothetical protein